MTDLVGVSQAQAILRLQTWLSPAFPIGSFAYSSGLEVAIADSLVKDRQSLQAWLEGLLRHGSVWNDAVFLAQAHSSGPDDTLREHALAACASAGRRIETIAQGNAFLTAAKPWYSNDEMSAQDFPLPIAIGIVAKDLPLLAVEVCFLNAFVINQTQVAQRLMPLGQTGAVAVQATMEETVLSVAKCAEKSTLDDLGSIAFMADIAMANHEHLNGKVFRT